MLDYSELGQGVTIYNQAFEEMDHELEACVECTQKCLLVHGNEGNASPVSISFFKIMFGKQFSEFMVLPPKVVPTLLLTVQETFIEDSRGLKWDVSITLIDGFFAFQQGWNAFSLDHNLKVGDFLVFNYIKGSHFTVKIYDNSGCEVNFSEIQHLKKRKRERDFSVNDGWCYKIDKNSMRKNGSGISANSDLEMSRHLYEGNGMENGEYANRENGDKPGENRAIDLDLSSYEEMKKMKVSGSDASNKVAAKTEACFHHPDSSLRLRTASASDKIPMTIEVVTSVIPSDTSEIERTKKRDKNLKKASDSEKDSSLRLRNGPASVKIPVTKEEITNAISSNTSEIERTLKKDDKVKKASASDKDSFTRMTSGHLFPTRSINPEQNEKTISDIPNGATKICHTADESGNDQVAVSRKEHNLVDGSFGSSNNKLAEVSKPYEETKDVSKTHSLNSKRKIITAAPSGAPDFESTKKNDYSEAKVIKLGSASGDVLWTKRTSLHLNALKCVKTKENEEIYPDISKRPTKLSQTADQSGESLKSSHKLKSQTKFPSENQSILQVVKPESVDADLVSNYPSSEFSCLVTTTAFQNLPKSFSLPLNSSKKRSTNQDTRTVRLRDSDNRLWPVLYTQKYLFRAFTNGWNAFCMANNIEPGHQITVEVTNPVEGTCRVQVIARDDMAIFDR